MITLYKVRKALAARSSRRVTHLTRWLENAIAPAPRFVIVGTGRSGTTYIASLLTQSGIPCGHESVFSHYGMKKCFGYVGDVSWLAVPYLSDFRGTVLHQTRDPISVINSLLGIKFFSPNTNEGFRRFAEKHFRFTGDAVRDAMRWYVDWNTRCEQFAVYRYRIEDIEDVYPELLRTLGRDCESTLERFRLALRATSKDLNARTKAGMRFVELPECREKDALRAIGDRYGYESVWNGG